jgi:hypothetical protein
MDRPAVNSSTKITGWILFAFISPLAVVSWLLGALSMLVWIAHKPRFEGHGILTLEFREWFASGKDGEGPWNFSTTIFRTVWWNPGVRSTAPGDVEEDGEIKIGVEELKAMELDNRVERHERVHIRQMEDEGFKGFFVGLLIAGMLWDFGWFAEGWQPFLVWMFFWMLFPLSQVFHWVTPPLRYGIRGRREDEKWHHWFKRAFDVCYRDSEIERSAYAQTDRWPDGESWWEKRDDKRL